MRAVSACPPGSLNVTVALPAVASMPPGTCMCAALSVQLAAANSAQHQSPTLSFPSCVALACQRSGSVPAFKACSRILQYYAGSRLSCHEAAIYYDTTLIVSFRKRDWQPWLTGSGQDDAMEEAPPCVHHRVTNHSRPICVRRLIDSFGNVPAEHGWLHMSQALSVTKLCNGSPVPG